MAVGASPRASAVSRTLRTVSAEKETSVRPLRIIETVAGEYPDCLLISVKVTLVLGLTTSSFSLLWGTYRHKNFRVSNRA